MSDEKTTRTPLEEFYNSQGTILNWLIDSDEQRPWSVEEIIREYGHRANATDALAYLHGAGLIHRMGEFVWATRAAIRAEEIKF